MDDREVVLGPTLGAVDALKTAADGRGNEAGTFLEYKLYATYELATMILRELESQSSKSKSEMFDLYLLVDTFLFESASIRDALYQFANAIFDLGIAADDRRIGRKVQSRYRPPAPVLRD